jgi:HK97 family phage portal protein
VFGIKKEVKDLGLPKEQSKIIINNTYNSELLLDNNYRVVAKEAFKGNADAYTVVDKLASDIARLDYKVFKVSYNKQGEADKEYVNDHPFLELIKKPNNDQGKYEYMYSLVMYFILSGQMFQKRVVSGGEPTRLFVLRPDTMGMLLAKSKQTGWYFEYNGQQTNYKYDEISYIRIPDPIDPYRGFSPLRACAYAIDGNNVTNKWNFSMIKNGARPSGILSTDQTLSDVQIKRLKSLLKGFWSGVFNAGKGQVLDGGMRWNQMSLSSKDMDGIEYHKLNSRKIAQVLQIPNQLLGFPDSATYANYAEANKAYTEGALLNMAQRIVDEWNNWLMPLYGDNIFIEINKDNIEALQENRNELSDRTIKQYDSGIIMRGEARQKLGYSEMEEDSVYKLTTSDVFYNPNTNKFIVPMLGIGDPNADDAKSMDSIINDVKETLLQVELKKKELKATLQTNVIISVLNSLDSEELHEDVKDYYYALIAEEGIRVFTDILEVDQTYSMSERINKYIEEDVLKNCTAIVDETLREKLSLQLLEGSEANETIAELKARIEKVFEEQYFISDVPNHAEVIARTEALSASSIANFDAYTESGVVEELEWLTAIDGRERDWHNTMHGQIVKLGDNFISGQGNKMKYPRQSGLPANEVIQCRCAVRAIVTGQKDKYDTIEKKNELWQSQDDEAMKYVEPMLENYDKAFHKQMDNVLNALDNI